MSDHRAYSPVDPRHDHNARSSSIELQFPPDCLGIYGNMSALDLYRAKSQRPGRFTDRTRFVRRDLIDAECLGKSRLGQRVPGKIFFAIVEPPGIALFGQAINQARSHHSRIGIKQILPGPLHPEWRRQWVPFQSFV